MKPWRIYPYSLGCRLNQSELEKMARQFAMAGHILVRDPVQADICVVNTCAVTEEAERKTRRAVRALVRQNPAARVAVVGCAATLDGEGLAELGVSWVVPNAEKDRVIEIVTGEAVSLPLLMAYPSASDPLRTRAFVKAQDGCDQHCTYCITRLLRGPSQSRSLDEIVLEIRSLVQAGYCEVVLTGVNLGSFGRDLGVERGLERLIAAVLERTDLRRLRLSSVEPWDLDAGLLALWMDARLCRQLHLPLQSGCDKTLRRMGRPVTTEQYARLAATARAAIPDLALSTDVIVGFPGETEADFLQSLAFVERMAFSRLHVFSFSPRPGTAAAGMASQIPLEIRRARARKMRELGAGLAKGFRGRFVGQEIDVLWERCRGGGVYRGWTDNYLRVVTQRSSDLRNSITHTRLVADRDGVLIGEVIE